MACFCSGDLSLRARTIDPGHWYGPRSEDTSAVFWSQASWTLYRGEQKRGQAVRKGLRRWSVDCQPRGIPKVLEHVPVSASSVLADL